MKIRYALMLTAVLAVPAAWADGPADAEDGQALQGLQLTETQKQQVRTIQTQARAKHEAIRKETQAAIGKILTPEQKAKFEQNQMTRAERREDRREDRQERREERQDAKADKKIDKLEKKIEKQEARKAQ